MVELTDKKTRWIDREKSMDGASTIYIDRLQNFCRTRVRELTGSARAKKQRSYSKDDN
ncbi:MAG: hypothetical protein ACRD47_06435 [Nitrososphaeraceae archaeon]